MLLQRLGLVYAAAQELMLEFRFLRMLYETTDAERRSSRGWTRRPPDAARVAARPVTDEASVRRTPGAGRRSGCHRGWGRLGDRAL